MKFHSSVIFVSDIHKSKEFYIQILKQEIDQDFGTNVSLKCGLSIWQIKETHIVSKQLDTTANVNRFELYFETEKIDEIFEKLLSAGVNFLHELHEEPWGQRTVRFFDPDQHLIEIGEPVDTFVINMSKNGLSAEQIAEKSGIPIEIVKGILK